jgi:hypothetical protein
MTPRSIMQRRDLFSAAFAAERFVCPQHFAAERFQQKIMD